MHTIIPTSFKTKLLAFCVLSISVGSQAQTVISDNVGNKASIENLISPYSFGNPTIKRSWGNPSACLDHTNTANPQNETFSLEGITLNNLTVNWTLTGGISKVSNPSSNSIVIKPMVVNGKYLPGQLTASYKGTKDSTFSCGTGTKTIQVPKYGSVSIKLAQKFQYTTSIKGPSCVTAGEEAHFFVDPLVSSSLDADGYKWQTINMSLPVTNKSGDNSFISSIVGTATYPCSLIVNVGACNQDFQGQKVKVVKQKMPKPAAYVIGYGTTKSPCVPVSSSQVTVSITSPQGGLDYLWSWDNTQFTVASGSPSSTSLTLIINGNSTGGRIILQSRPQLSSVQYCSIDNQPLFDTITINRSLGNGVISGPTCVGAGETGLAYTISGAVSNPISWTLPAGWVKTSETNNSIVVTSSSNVTNSTIHASISGACSSNATLQIGPKVGTIPSNIAGPDCIEPGDVTSKQYSVSAIPTANAYHWTLPQGWTAPAATLISTGTYRTTVSSIDILPTGNTFGILSVVPVGSCGNGTAVSVELKPASISPSAITFLGAKNCINAGAADHFGLKVVNPVRGQSYSWNVTTSDWNLTGTSSEDSSFHSIAYFTTNGTSGTVSVTVAATSSCGTSTPFSKTYSIVPNTARLDSNFDAVTEIYRFVVRDNTTNTFFPSGTSYKWYKNGAEIVGQTTRVLNVGTGSSPLTSIAVDVTPAGATCATRVTKTTRNANQLRMSQEEDNLPVTMEVFPNPVGSELRISLSLQEGETPISIIQQSTGITMKQFSALSKISMVNTESWPSGIYTIRAYANGKQLTKSIVVQH